MPQRIGFGVKRLVACQTVKDAFVERERVMKIVEYLLTLGFNVTFMEKRSFSDQVGRTAVAIDLGLSISGHVFSRLE